MTQEIDFNKPLKGRLDKCKTREEWKELIKNPPQGCSVLDLIDARPDDPFIITTGDKSK